MHGVVAVEVAPCFAGAKISHHDAVATLGGGIGDVCDALAGGAGEVGAQVESDVIEVAVWIGDGGREENGLEDGVVGEVDADKFRSSIRGGHKRAVGCLDTTCIKDPCSVE